MFAWGALDAWPNLPDAHLTAYRALEARESAVPPAAREDYWRAQGRTFADCVWSSEPSLSSTLASAQKEAGRLKGVRRERFLNGTGAWIYHAWGNDGDWPGFDTALLQTLPVETRRAILFGAGAQSALDPLLSIEDRALDARRRGSFLNGLDAAALDDGRRWVFERFGF
jgi:hypothetical protein